MKQKSQKERLLELLREGYPVRTDAIVETVYGQGLSLARVGARIWDLKHERHVIVGWKDHENPALYWYALVFPEFVPYFHQCKAEGMSDEDAYFEAPKRKIVKKVELSLIPTQVQMI